MPIGTRANPQSSAPTMMDNPQPELPVTAIQKEYDRMLMIDAPTICADCSVDVWMSYSQLAP
eukprot:566368-Pyramimonas_sp.AAC.1